MVSLREEGIRKEKGMEIVTPWTPWLHPVGDGSSALSTGLCGISGCLAPRVQSGAWCPACHGELSGWLYYSEHMMLWLQQLEIVSNSAELGMGFSPAEVSIWVVSGVGGLAW